MPGVAMLRDSNTALPQPIRTRAFSPQDVIDLPAHTVWSRRASSTGATASDIRARVSLEKAGQPSTVVAGSDITLVMDEQIGRVSAADRDEQILHALRADPCQTMASLARTVGIHKQTVKRSVERLADAGLVKRDSDGCWSVVG